MVNTPFISTRRAFLGAALSFAAMPGKAMGLPRLAAIDWAMLETALALGAPPAAACELIRFRADSGISDIPVSMVDLGLRGSPNFELLSLTKPDLILSSNYYSYIEPRLSRTAPVLSHSFYVENQAPWPKALAALKVLGTQIGLEPRADVVKAAAQDTLNVLASRLKSFSGRPVYAIQIGDSRHFRAFGADSLFGNVLERLGLKNAWTEGTAFSFAAPVPLERLAETPEAIILTVSGVPPLARRGLERSVLWNRLTPVTQGRVYDLGDMNPFGAVPTGLRFAHAVTRALTGASS